MLGLVLVTYSVQPTKLIESIPVENSEFKWYVNHHGSDDDVINNTNNLIRERNSDISEFRVNRGLGKSWNESIYKSMCEGCTGVILLNDDLFFYEGAFSQFIDFIRDSDKHEAVGSASLMGNETRAGSPSEVHRQAYACMYVNRKAIERIGYFDEGFTPAYFEDVDHARRCELAGLISPTDTRVLVEHERSSTIRKSPELANSIKNWFKHNEEYYISKWGGGIGREVYDTPFNRKDTDLRITWERRSNPYHHGEQD